jgi:hypothetical protein
VKRSWVLGVPAIAFALGAAGCAVQVVAAPPAIPIVPVSFESNLVSAQQCEFRGVAGSEDEARAAGANLVLAFTYADESTVSVTASNTAYGPQGTAVWVASDMRGKAVSCPKEALDRILSMNRNAKSQ